MKNLNLINQERQLGGHDFCGVNHANQTEVQTDNLSVSGRSEVSMTLDEQPGNHPVITPLSPSNHPLLPKQKSGKSLIRIGKNVAESHVRKYAGASRVWKYAAMVVLMVTLGVGEMWAYNEYNKKYLYFNGSEFTSFFNDACTPYINAKWDYAGNDATNNGGNKEMTQIGTSYFYYLDLSLASSSYKSFRGFYIGRSASFHNGAMMGYVDGSTDNCIKATGWGTYEWSKYAPPMASVTIAKGSMTTYGGSGTTPSDPILVAKGGTIQVTVTGATSSVPDDQTIYYQFYKSTNEADRSEWDENSKDVTTRSFTAANTANTTYAITVDAQNEYYGVYGNTATSNTLYFKTIEPIYAVLGGFNSWTPSATYNFSGPVEGVYTASFTINKGSYTFKAVIDGGYYGNGQTYSRGSSSPSNELSTSGGDMTITADVTGTYTFSFNFTAKTLTVTYPTAYTVTYGKGTGGSSVSASAASAGGTFSSGALVRSGDVVTFTQTAATGYSFKGWYTASSGGTDAGVDGDGHLTINAAKTVYAQYDPMDYVITLDKNTGSTNGSVTATYNSTATKDFTAVAKTGYDCTGYWTAESGGYKVVNANGKLVSYSSNVSTYLNTNGTWKKTDATTLYAQWTAQTYTITLDENGDYQGNGSATATYDSGLSGISLPSRTGYHVEGYYKENTYTNKIANADGTLCVSTDYTDASSRWTHVGAVPLYAKWTANTYTVHFDPNDDEYVGTATGSMADQGFTYAAAQTLTSNGFTREGYTFAGWNSQEDGEGTDYTDGKSVSNLTAENGGSVTLYAKWTAEDYVVTLNYGMGERGTNPASITVTMGATYVSSGDLSSLENHLPTLADASGYYFTGWYTSPSGGTKITDETIVTTASAHTLYARFVERSYVYFYNNLGWENVYVIFNAEWVNNKGTGVMNTRTFDTMERIGETNVWRFLIPEYALKTEWQYFIAFSNTNAVDGAYHLYSGKAVFRKDFDSYATMFVPASGGTTFVPSDYSGAGNGITYYSTDQWDWSAGRHKDGYWKRYNSTEGGYTIKGSWDSWANDNYLKSVTTDGWTYSFSKYLDANTTYQFLLYKHCTTSNTATSTFTNTSGNAITETTENIEFTTQNAASGSVRNSRITTTAAGEYVFTLTCGTDGTLKLSVKYPLTANQEYRVLYSWTKNGNDSTHASEYIHAEPGTSKKISVFVHKSSAVTSRSLTIQKCTAIDGSGNPTWTNGNTIDLSSVGESGVYNFVITQPASGNPTGAYSEPYTGDYYIRTDAADGGWDFYKEIGDNKMKLSEFSLTQELSDPYSHYYCKFINSTSTNITYQIATDYSPCVSEVMVGDATIGGVSIKTLPATANVRFSWNCKTNALRRAYLKDAQGNSNARYLVLHGADGKILNTDGTAIAASGDLEANELQFTDNGNWVYQVSLKAQPGANVCLIANYNSDDRYLVGNGSSEWLTIMGGSGTSTYDITAVYDFKTNRLMTAWTPSGAIKDQLKDVDVMLVRHAQENANTITFAENETTHTMGSLTANKIIGALEMRYDELFGHVTNWTSDSRPLLKFMVSFPFDVNVSDVFGLNSAYGEAYVIERYAGDERAAKGFFRGDGTSTFWTELEPGDVMKANEGYCVILDNEYFNGDLGKVWENKGTGSKVYLYFPSASNVGAINATEKSYTVPAHTCEIDRTFGSPAKNHMNTDSHWNLIGVPIFANHAASSAAGTPGAVLTNDGDYFHHFYAWNPTDNQFYIATASSTVFKAMYSYMVQYHGDIKFVGAATPTPSSVAARRAPEKKNYEIELQVLNNDAEMINRTYVELRDEAEDGFMLNEDVYMSTNNKAVNIYTFAGNYDVAANVQSVNNHTIPVGVIVNKTGTYSFSMPSNFDGTVTLIDNFTQTRTNLALEDYEIQLEKGTINDRFLLEIDIHKVSTAIDGVTDGTGSLKDGKAHKFIENGAMYILRDGVVYDARGTKVK
jgi:uncharacterized repeat protein (TIGR02543 family)